MLWTVHKQAVTLTVHPEGAQHATRKLKTHLAFPLKLVTHL